MSRPVPIRWLTHTGLTVLVIGQLAACVSVVGYHELQSDRVAQLASLMPEEPAGFGPPCNDRLRWGDAALRKRVASVITAAESLQRQPFPAWDDDAYLEYSRKGVRPNGERMMNARKAWLYPLVLAECVEGEGRFLPAIERTLRELVAQPTWTWPAHDPILKNFRRSDYDVDLYAADTAHDLAQALHLLGDRIDTTVRAQTLAALEQRVFAPVRRSLAGGDTSHWWLRANHNWNAVCLKGVVAAALTVLPERQDRAVFAAAGEHYSRYYLSGFTTDGYVTEGPNYWNYGFSHFAELREALLQASGNSIDLFSEAKVRNIALYGSTIEMFPGNVAAFSDADPDTKMDAFSIAYANEALGLGLTQRLAELPISARQSGNSAPLTTASLILFGRPLAITRTNDTNAVGLRTYFDQAGVLVARPASGSQNRLAVSIKAGGNGNHSHNDIGSYTIALANEQPTGDVGRPGYTSKTFSRQRYTIKSINSYGHPVPLVAGQLQLEATKVKPKVTLARFTPALDEFAIDLRPAYAVPELEQLTRTLRYARTEKGSVEIEDRFEYSVPLTFEVPLTTLGDWHARTENLLEIWHKKERLLVRIEASDEYDLVSEKIDEEGLPFHRIAVRLRRPQTAGFIKVRFTALE